jgi:hypothetical protein
MTIQQRIDRINKTLVRIDAKGGIMTSVDVSIIAAGAREIMRMIGRTATERKKVGSWFT